MRGNTQGKVSGYNRAKAFTERGFGQGNEKKDLGLHRTGKEEESTLAQWKVSRKG